MRDRRNAAPLIQALAALATFMFSGPSYGQEPESVVYIKCEGPDGNIIRGSGVIVSDRGRVLTAKHVAPPGYQCKGILGTAAEEPTRSLLRRRSSPDYDGMLLEFVPKANERFHAVFALKLEPELQGKQVAAYGFPAGGVGQVSVRTGSISTTIPSEQGMVEIDARITTGMSGGPVFLQGRSDALVGIISSTHFHPSTGLPANFAVLAAELLANEFELTTTEFQDTPAQSATGNPHERGTETVPVRIADELRSLMGKWSGEATEPSGSKFRVEMEVLPSCTLNGPCGTVAVPNVPCRGRLTLVEKTPGGYEFSVDQFDATSDLSLCTPGAGEILKPLPDGTLAYTASYSGAHGILQKDAGDLSQPTSTGANSPAEP